MTIAIDHSPLVSSHKMAHRIRGTGFYTKNLILSLKKYHPENTYILFTQGERTSKPVDIYHFPYFDPFFLTLPFKKMGKTVITIHDLTPLVFPEIFPIGVKGRIKFQIQKLLAKKVDAIITDSQCSKIDIEKILNINPDKIFPVPLAASEKFKKINITKIEKEKLLKKYNIPEDFLLYVGDATPNKNLKRLIDTVKKLNIPFVIVGGAVANKNIDKNHPWNKDIAYIQKAADSSDNIFILGFVPDEDLVLLYNLTTVFVMPSLYEGFGLPVLEAAACGCPIATSRSGSIPEVIGDSAVFFDPYDVNDMFEKIKYLFENKNEQVRYSHLSYKRSKIFSWKKTADETVKIYEKVLS